MNFSLLQTAFRYPFALQLLPQDTHRRGAHNAAAPSPALHGPHVRQPAFVVVPLCGTVYVSSLRGIACLFFVLFFFSSLFSFFLSYDYIFCVYFITRCYFMFVFRIMLIDLPRFQSILAASRAAPLSGRSTLWSCATTLPRRSPRTASSTSRAAPSTARCPWPVRRTGAT